MKERSKPESLAQLEGKPKPEIATLRAAETNFRILVESVRDYAIIMLDPEGRVASWNAGAERINGYHANEIIGKHFSCFYPTQTVQLGWPQRELELAKAHGRFEDEGWRVRKNGSRFWANVIITALKDEKGRLLGFAKVARDITERKRAEQALRESETRFRLLIDYVKDYAIFLLDPAGIIVSWNGGAQRIIGYRAEEIIGKHFSRFYPREAMDAGLPDKELSLAAAEGRFEDEGWRLRKDGSQFWANVVLTALRDESGQLRGFAKITRDMSERKAAEERLRHAYVDLETRVRERTAELAESQERLRLAQRAGKIGTFDLLIPSQEIIWSEQLEALYGLPPGGFGGKFENWTQAIYPQDRERVETEIRNAVQGEAAFDTEFRIVWPDRTLRWIAARASVVRDEAGRPLRLIGTNTDITERHRLEDQLRQAQKMEAVGRLAGGVAHDFNNVLTIVTGYSELLLEQGNIQGEDRVKIEEIRKAGERAAALTRQFLAFSRQQVLQPQVLDLNSLVVDMERMLRRLIGEHIELKAVLGEALGRVKADPGQIEQVLMNLTLNARDAMPEGGKMTLETANVQLNEAYARQHPFMVPGPYVMLAVSDTGCGMDAETQSRIFEPFFTTKEKGRGTGLGLSTVYGIVKQSGGHIMVYSDVGHGTSFRIYLPRVDEAMATSEVPISARGSLVGTETILLVEDDVALRSLVQEVLQSKGYKVLAAVLPEEAVRICQEHTGPLDLIVTDVVMPQMSGRQLVDSLSVAHPEAKVLFMSGYTDGHVAHLGMLRPGRHFLQKPFTPEALERKVRELLDQKLSE